MSAARRRPFTVGRILRDVARSYRYRFGRIVVSAAVVFGALAVVDVLVDHVSRHDHPGLLDALILVAGALARAIGTTFYPGLLDRIVGEYELGHPPEPVGRVLRTLPYGSLIIADVLVVLATAVGTLLLVIPGVIAYTLFAITGPLINVEGRGPISGMRRSAQLVRHHFWFVLLLVVVPLELEHAVVHASSHFFIHDALVVVFALNAVTGMIVGSFVGLVVVNVAFALVRDDRAPREAPENPKSTRLHRGRGAPS